MKQPAAATKALIVSLDANGLITPTASPISCYNSSVGGSSASCSPSRSSSIWSSIFPSTETDFLSLRCVQGLRYWVKQPTEAKRALDIHETTNENSGAPVTDNGYGPSSLSSSPSRSSSNWSSISSGSSSPETGRGSPRRLSSELPGLDSPPASPAVPVAQSLARLFRKPKLAPRLAFKVRSLSTQLYWHPAFPRQYINIGVLLLCFQQSGGLQDWVASQGQVLFQQGAVVAHHGSCIPCLTDPLTTT